SAIGRELQGLPGFASGGQHSGGWRIVGERGPELEATGPARYFTAAQTQRMLAGDGGAQQVHVTVGVDPATGNLTAFVDDRADLRVSQSDRQFPVRWAEMQRQTQQRMG